VETSPLLVNVVVSAEVDCPVDSCPVDEVPVNITSVG